MCSAPSSSPRACSAGACARRRRSAHSPSITARRTSRASRTTLPSRRCSAPPNRPARSSRGPTPTAPTDLWAPRAPSSTSPRDITSSIPNPSSPSRSPSACTWARPPWPVFPRSSRTASPARNPPRRPGSATTPLPAFPSTSAAPTSIESPISPAKTRRRGASGRTLRARDAGA